MDINKPIHVLAPVMTEPEWITDEVVLAIHRRQIAEHGGMDGVRDKGLLESALAKPKNLYHYKDPKPTIANIEASYACGIARNHPFIDANKRTALETGRLFRTINGVELKATEKDKYQTFTITEDALSCWVAQYS